MKKFLIVIFSAATASILTVILSKSLGYESSAFMSGGVGGGVGGVTAAIVSVKLFSGKQKNT